MKSHLCMPPLVLLLGALCALPACSSCGSKESALPTPRQVDSGFEFAKDAFIFENFGGGSLAPQLSPYLMMRMFGEEVVCEPGMDPCTLTGAAQTWMQGTNKTLDQGRSEGFSIASLLFFTGELDPKDFGADKVSDLRLEGNPKLQNELAYWAATQAVPTTALEDVRHEAKDALPFLAKVLDAGSERHYRLAIAQRTERGFARGHALTPIGYYKGEGDVYWLRVYDNNFPQNERKLEINPVANTWRYEFAGVDGTPIVYESSPEKRNYLYFSPVERRLGVLKAPFAADSEYVTQTYSGVTIVATNEDGEETGIRDGEVVEAQGDWVTPAFSSCPLCGTAVAIVNQATLAKGFKPKNNITVTSAPDVRTTTTPDGAKVSIQNYGLGFASSLESKKPQVGDAVTFGKNGDITYASKMNGEGITLTSTRKNGDGTSSTVTVTVKGSESAAAVTLKNDENGNTTVDVESLPPGVEVVVQTSTNEGGKTRTDSFEYTSNGEPSKVTVDNSNGSVDLSVAQANAAQCSNSTKDTMETDVDCGGLCGPTCAEGKACTNDGDCASGACLLNLCVENDPNCNNGRQSPGETGVDCGGDLCGPCKAVDGAAAPGCTVNTDCDSNICHEQKCRVSHPIIARFDVLPRIANYYISFSIDGKSGWKKFDFSDSTKLEYELGKGHHFTYQYAPQCNPKGSTQVFTGKSDAQDQETRGILEMDCPSGSEKEMRVNVHFFSGSVDTDQYNFNIQEYQRNPVMFAVSVDGGPLQIKTATRENAVLGTYQDYWSYKIIRSSPGLFWIRRGHTKRHPVHCYSSIDPGNSREFSADYFRTMRKESETPLIYCQPDENLVASCTDRFLNQHETSTDCGGMCGACDAGSLCLVQSDCGTGMTCTGYKCIWSGTCTDNMKNRDESDVDCGGSCAQQCPANSMCAQDGDCQTGLTCINNQCRQATCYNMMKDADETDVDCGNMCTTKCDYNKACSQNSDCIMGADCVANVCISTACSNGAKDAMEADTDCGGICPNKCTEYASCTMDTDCLLGLGCINSQCLDASCYDMSKDANETDVDCGGGCDTKCAEGKMCAQTSDCITGLACLNNVCTMSQCDNLIKDGDEMDVDCGGSCDACALSKSCTLDSDCVSQDCECGENSGNCTGATGTCGAGKWLFDQPTTDGVASSGSVSIPAQCTQVYVQAWGAAGGSGDSGMGLAGPSGGASGFVFGTLPVAQGDIVTVWVGQGGSTDATGAGTPSIGSMTGTRVDGGGGDSDLFAGGGGGGGGLTSVQQSGSASTTFLVPGGGGGNNNLGEGQDVTAGFGGGAGMQSGQSASFNSGEGGGGAGSDGGTTGNAGTYGSIPAGLMTADGSFGEPAQTSNPDYSDCMGSTMGMPGAGAGDTFMLGTRGGDGCVVLRCIAP